MIVLAENEIKDLLNQYDSYEITQNDNLNNRVSLVSRKFPSTGRIARGIELDKTFRIYEVVN